MAIKWSALKVNEEIDKAEKFIKEAETPLKLAKLVVAEARRLPNLPQYMDTRLISLISQIERMDKIKSVLQSVRDDIPKDALEEDRKQSEYGTQQSLV